MLVGLRPRQLLLLLSLALWLFLVQAELMLFIGCALGEQNRVAWLQPCPQHVLLRFLPAWPVLQESVPTFQGLKAAKRGRYNLESF
jgi:hypothetical protein